MTAYSKWAAIKVLRRRPLSVFFWRSFRKLEEATPQYGYVLGATQQEMLS